MFPAADCILWEHISQGCGNQRLDIDLENKLGYSVVCMYACYLPGGSTQLHVDMMKIKIESARLSLR